MLEHRQTLFGEGQGDCFRTCIECILDLPVATLPNFCSWPADTWFERTAEYLRLNRLADDLIRMVVSKNERVYQSGLDRLCGIGIKDYHGRQDCLVMEDVMTVRGLKHNIISKVTISPNHFAIEKIHDPHPNGGDTWPEHKWFSFYALVGKGLWKV